LRYYPSICPEGLRKTMKVVITGGLRVEISTRDLPHAEEEC
jgi:hypothetical protein